MSFIDYYKILGIDKKASQETIRKAYRKLARKYHPDLNPNDNEAKSKFQQINEANKVLSDPENRKKYDQYGKDWAHADEFEKAKRNQASSPGGAGRAYGGEDFSDFFESMFGGAARGGRQIKFRGEDFQASLQLSLLDAYKTHKHTLHVNGKKIRITVPSGVENGQTIKIKGYGGAGINGGPNGDLYITFSIGTHPDFRRLGNNVYATADLDLYTAILVENLL
jgi:curved DNA-binding protein